MADESPSEREERLQKAEERLQKQHSRLMDQPDTKGGGGFGVSWDILSEQRTINCVCVLLHFYFI
jgi:hypothetical protein